MTAVRYQVSDAADQVTFLQPPPMLFEHFYASCRDHVGRSLAMTLNDDALGFEAADEAMARAYERWAEVSGYQNPEGWVYRTGLNWAKSWLRRRKRSKPKDRLLAAADLVVDHHPDTDLAEAIAALNDEQRAVVILRFYRDWTVEQTAEALGVAPGTVKSRLSRATDQLQNHLDPGSQH